MSSTRPLAGAAFAQADAVELAHVLVAHIAAASSMRVLSIKGPAADHYALRLPHRSADADVLLPTKDFERFCRELEARGWHQRVARDTPLLIEAHSRTYIHPDWPCDIDVHDRFPGFFEDPDVVFDVLWEHRTSLNVGHAVILIPTLEASAVVGALHALRNMSVPRHEAEWNAIIDALKNRFTQRQQDEFVRIAEAGRARWVLRDAFEAMEKVPVENDLTEEERQVWSNHVRFGADGGAVGWVLALKDGTLRQRALTLMRAILVPPSLIPRNDESTKLSAMEVLRYQRARWARGARALTNFLRSSLARVGS